MTNVRTRAILAIAALSSLAGCPEANAPSGGGGGGGGAHELVGSPAPSFSAETVNGKGKVSLDEEKGKVVIVDFWATWCKPCQKSFPKFEELRVKYGASGLDIIGVSEDDEPDDVAKFGENYGAKFALVWDKDKAIAGQWHPPNMPTTFIIDKKGVVRFAHLGYHEGEEKEIENEVKSLL